MGDRFKELENRTCNADKVIMKKKKSLKYAIFTALSIIMILIRLFASISNWRLF